MFSVSQWAIKRVTPKVLFVHWIRAAAASCANPLPCADFFRHQPSSADGIDCAEPVEAAGTLDCAGVIEAVAMVGRPLLVEAEVVGRPLLLEAAMVGRPLSVEAADGIDCASALEAAGSFDCAEPVEAAMVGRPLLVEAALVGKTLLLEAAGSFDCAGVIEAAAIFSQPLSVEAAAPTGSFSWPKTAGPLSVTLMPPMCSQPRKMAHSKSRCAGEFHSSSARAKKFFVSSIVSFGKYNIKRMFCRSEAYSCVDCKYFRLCGTIVSRSVFRQKFVFWFISGIVAQIKKFVSQKALDKNPRRALYYKHMNTCSYV